MLSRFPVSLILLTGIASAATQSIVLEDAHPSALQTQITDYLDVKKASISGNADATSLIAALKGAKRFYSDRSGDPTAPETYCIIHVVHWSDPAKQTNSSKIAQKVDAQNWYLYNSKNGWSQDDFATNKRIFGAKHLFFLYIHLNKAVDASLRPRYEISVTSKEPANFQHLFALAASFLPTGQEGANALPPAVANYFGIADFNIAYSPSDISITPFVVEADPDNNQQLVHNGIGDSVVFDDEGNYWWDVSVAVPIRKESQLTFNNTNNTVTAQNVDKRNVFAVLDLYPWKRDIKSQSFDLHPYGVIGVAVASQPLHKILVGAGWGPKYAQFYAGALFVQQQDLATLSNGSVATPAQQAADTRLRYKPQFAFGINLPVREIFQAATSKNPTSSNNSTGTASQKTTQNASGAAK